MADTSDDPHAECRERKKLERTSLGRGREEWRITVADRPRVAKYGTAALYWDEVRCTAPPYFWNRIVIPEQGIRCAWCNQPSSEPL